MKKIIAALGIAFALICGGAFVYANANNSDTVEQTPETVKVSLDDAIEKYIETEQPEVDIVDVVVYDRSFDADYSGDIAQYMVQASDGTVGFGTARVESLANWYAQNA